MSTTEPAPLPRLGEVFFDVRSKARSLRISWYSDTGVAVLSIWQGGTCTGSFRLPMGDVPRLIATLQAGPPAGDSPGAGPAAPAQYGGPAGPRQPADADGSLHYPGGGATAPYPGQAPAAAADPYGSGPYPASTAPASTGPASYPPAAAAGYPGEASGYPAPAYPAAAPPAAAHPASPYPADPYPPGPSGYAPPPAGSHPATPPYETSAAPYGNSGEYTRTGDFLRPAYLDPPAEPPVADRGHRSGSHRAVPDYGADQNYGASQDYGASQGHGAGQDYQAGHDYGARQEYGAAQEYGAGPGYGAHRDPEARADYPPGQGYPAGPSPSDWDYRSPVAVGVSTGPLPESHPYGEPGGQDSDPPGSSGSFA